MRESVLPLDMIRVQCHAARERARQLARLARALRHRASKWTPRDPDGDAFAKFTERNTVNISNQNLNPGYI